MTVESVNDFSKYKTAEAIAEKYPFFSAWGLRRDGGAREFNGMAEEGACIIYKHKKLFHEDRLLSWWEKRYGRGAS